MICINPYERKTLTIDGATFTLRPLTWADRLELIGVEGAGPRVIATLTKAVVDAQGLFAPSGLAMPFDANALPPDAALELLSAVNALSGVSETDRKNSSSPSGQNPAAVNAPSTWTGNESAASMQVS